MTYQQDESDGYTVKGTALTAPGTAIAKGDLVINGVEIFDADIASDSFKGKLDVINAASQETGVVASASFSQTFTIDTSNLIEGDKYTLNGTELTLTSSETSVAALATLINTKSDEIGLTASVNGNNLVLSGDNVQSLTINNETLAVKNDAMTSTDTDAEIRPTAGTVQNHVVTIQDADVKAGREFNLKLTGGIAANNFDVKYTAVSGDTARSC